MQEQMRLGMALDQYTMSEFANGTLQHCWDICYDRNLARTQLVSGDVPEATLKAMDNCGRKCIARHFEVMKLLMESRELREKEALQGLAPGTLSAQNN